MSATRVWRLNLIDVMGIVAAFALVFASVSKRWFSLWATYILVASLVGFAVGGILGLVTLLLLRSVAAVTTGGALAFEIRSARRIRCCSSLARPGGGP